MNELVSVIITTHNRPLEMVERSVKSVVNQTYKNIEIIVVDDNNPNDCAKEPHDLTHSVDALRYYAISRVLYQEEKPKQKVIEIDDKEEEDYDDAMTGGAPDRSYLGI